ncbi:MAG: hypothetical protein PHR81_06970 [Bacteroidales bacterium]|nr:hypothetical protein [Bacteroidales bacterium]MDD4214537.1 hypothetical protein [Bacteroidales bacterium]
MGKKYLFFTSIKIIPYVLACVMFCYVCFSCKKTNLIPAYIHIDSIGLTTTYELDGTTSHKITDAWVYIDGSLQGIYELPATFPILTTGKHTIHIKPGIKINGIAKSRGYYPFFQPYEASIDLQPEETDTVNPIVTYYAEKIQWKEDFDAAGISLAKFGLSDTNFIQTSEASNIFEGYGSGIVTFDANYDYLLTVTNDIYDIPQTQAPVFLEMNYKTDVEFAVGLFAILSNNQTEKLESLILNPNSSWNKIYINLTGVANMTSNTTGFRVYFESIKPDSIATAKILVDNLKLLYSK